MRGYHLLIYDRNYGFENVTEWLVQFAVKSIFILSLYLMFINDFVVQLDTFYNGRCLTEDNNTTSGINKKYASN